MARHTLRIALVGIVATAALGVGLAARSAGASSPQVTTMTVSGKPYTPKTINGGTDDYHCTLVDPHVTHDSFIVSSQFFPNSVEVHHAILFLVPPSLVSAARQADRGGKGWTCFGESALPNTVAKNQISNTPWLTAWAPGHGLDVVPAGTGVQFPAGSLVVEQLHYNLLRGDKPVHASLQLRTVPGSAHLKPLSLQLLPAPPDVPCAAGVTGPLCDRTAALADVGKRFGAHAIVFDNVIESVCGRDPSNPPVGNTTTCVWHTGAGQKLLRLTPHMHLTGQAMQITLNPGTPEAKTLLDVPNYNFDYQRSYTLKTPVTTKAGDTIGVTCTFNPKLHQMLPQLRKLPPRFVVWGDGSSDEMCLAIIQSVKA
jgi:hypothetical protein